MAEDISPYSYFGEENIEVRNAIADYIEEKKQNNPNLELDFGLDALNFLATTAVTLIARRIPGGEALANIPAITLWSFGQQVGNDIIMDYGTGAEDRQKAVITSIIDGLITLGVAHLTAGMAIGLGWEALLVFGATYGLSKMVSGAYDRAIDTIAVQSLGSRSYQVQVASPMHEVIDRLWESDLVHAPRWSMQRLGEDLILNFESSSKTLQINQGGIADERLMDIILQKIGENFPLLKNINGVVYNDFVYNYINKSHDELKSLSYSTEDGGKEGKRILSSLIRLRPFVLESDKSSYSGINQEIFSDQWREDRALFQHYKYFQNASPEGEPKRFFDMGKNVQTFSDTSRPPSDYLQYVFGSESADVIEDNLFYNDHLYGMGGNDTIKGNRGDDYIEGGSGQDYLDGGDGDDIFGIIGHDADYDTFVGGDGFDKILGSQYEDTIRLHDFSGENSVEAIDGGSPDKKDIIAGTSSGDTLDLVNTQLIDIEEIVTEGGNDSVTIKKMGGDSGIDKVDLGDDTDTLFSAQRQNEYDYEKTLFNLTNSVLLGVETVVLRKFENTILLSSFEGMDAPEEIIGNGTKDTIKGTDEEDFFDFSQTVLTGIEYLDTGLEKDTIVFHNIDETSELYEIDMGGEEDTISGTAEADYIDLSNVFVKFVDKVELGDLDDTIKINFNNSFSIDGGDGHDILIGTEKYDYISFSKIDNINEIYTAGSDDELFIHQISADDGLEKLDGGAGNYDSIYGTEGSDTLDFREIEVTGFERIYGTAKNSTIDDDDTIGVNKTLLEQISIINGGWSTGDTILGSDEDEEFDLVAKILDFEIIDAGGGKDTIIVNQSLLNSAQSIDGGGDEDTLKGTSGSETYKLDLLELIGFEVLDTGGGGDKIVATGFSKASGFHTIKGQGDRIEFSTTASSMTIDLSEIRFEGISETTIYGTSSADIIKGSSLKDIIEGGGSGDTVEGGEGEDVYKVSSGTTVKDTDGQGYVHFNGMPLTGGERKEEDPEGVYEGNGGQYTLSGNTLTFNGAGGTLTITGYSKGDLHIRLTDREDEEEDEDQSQDGSGSSTNDFSSPLILDLNHNQLTSTGVFDTDTHFDLDGDGFRERTGWVEQGDGLLALDRNTNGIVDDGTELFGNFTLDDNGNSFSDGFAALKSFDDDHDNQITEKDDIYEDLRIWMDEDADGVSQADELKSLADLNIPSISLDDQQIDEAEGRNTISHQSLFTQLRSAENGEILTDVDGNPFEEKKLVNDVWFFREPKDTKYDFEGEVPPEILDLPEMAGKGRVLNLSHAMTLDEELVVAVEDLLGSTGTGLETLRAKAETVLVRWTRTDHIDPDKTRGAQYILNHNYTDPQVKRVFRNLAYARDIAILESFAGRSFEMTVDGKTTTDILTVEASRSLNEKYEYLRDSVIINLIAQELYGKDVYDIEEKDLDYETLCSRLETDLLGPSGEDKTDAARLLLALIERDRRAVFNYLDAKLVLADAEIDAFLTSNGVQLSADAEGNVAGSIGDMRYFGDGSDTVYGTSRADEIRAGGGDDTVFGNEQDDIIYGGDGNDVIDGGEGNDFLYGGNGNDVLKTGGGYGHDVMDGGPGDDVLTGSHRSSTYVYVYGEGNDTITDSGQVGTTPDVLRLRGIRAEDLKIERQGNDLFLHVQDVGSTNPLDDSGSVRIVDAFGKGKIERFELEDGVLTFDELLTRGGFNDTSYTYNLGDGVRLILDNAGADTIYFGPGITPERLLVRGFADSKDLVIAVAEEGILFEELTQRVAIRKGFSTDKAVEHFVFSDGTEMSLEEVLALQSTDGDDLIRTFALGGNVSAGAGDDTVYGDAGADTLAGGPGADTLNGDGGNDTYRFDRGDGRDTVTDTGGTDTLAFGAGISAADLAVVKAGEDVQVGLVEDGVDFENLADKLTLSDWYSPGSRIETFSFADGSYLDTSDVLSKMAGGGVIYGLETDDTIQGSESADFIYGRGGNDVLIGLGGEDELFGEAGNDTLVGGTENDVLYGHGGNDRYEFNIGDGRDIIEDQDGLLNAGFDTLAFGPGISPEDLVVFKDGLDVAVGIQEPGAAFEELSDTILLKDWYYSDGQRRIDRFSFDDGTVLDAAGLVSLMGTDGDDEVVGVDADTTFYDTPGSDRYAGKNGNDAYHFSPGGGKDEISDNRGDDRIIFDAGIQPQDLTVVWRQGTGDIEITFDGRPDDALLLKDWYITDLRIESFEFSGGAVWDEVDLLAAMGTEGEDVFNGAADLANNLNGRGGPDIISGAGFDDFIDGGDGDDGIDGQEGEDTLIGGPGDDSLWGGPDSDTYVFNRGDGKDTIFDKTPDSWSYDYAGFEDTLRFGPGIVKEDLVFKVDEDTDRLYVGVLDPVAPETPFEELSDTITIENWYLSGNRIERIELTQTDDVLTPDDVLLAMGTDGDDTIKALSEGSILDGRDGNDTLYGNKRSDTLSGSGGDDAIFGRDGADTLSGGAGADFINGEEGDDTYHYNIGDGSDIIEDRFLDTELRYGWTTKLMRWDYYEVTELLDGGDDTLAFGDGITIDSLAIRPTGDNLVIALKEGDTPFDDLPDRITILDFFSEKTAIEHYTFIDGAALDPQGVTDLLFTDGDDEVVFETGEPLVLNARGGNDTVVSGAGSDIISGGTGNDVLNGNSGDDVYLFARGDGRDVIDDRADSSWWVSSAGDDTLRFASGIAPEEVTIAWGGELSGFYLDGDFIGSAYQAGAEWEDHDLDLVVGITEAGKTLAELSDRVFLAEWFNELTKIEKISFADGTTLTAQQMLDAVFSGSGDFIDVWGADLGHVFNAEAGEDEIYATEGKDTVYAGAGDDLVEGGTGSDQIFGGDGNDILFGLQSDPDDEDVLSYSPDRDSLSGGAGDDELYGLGGSDALAGGTGRDRLEGGGSSDSYRFSRGDGEDQILDQAGFQEETYQFDRFGHENQVTVFHQIDAGRADQLVFGEGITPQDVMFVWAAATGEDGTAVDRRFDIGTDDLVVVLKDPANPDAPIESLTDRITIRNFFTRLVPWDESAADDGEVQPPPYQVLNAEYVNRIEEFKFADGTVLSGHDLSRAMASEGDDRIEAVLFEDSDLVGLAGNDVLVGHVGDDELLGGAGDDRLEGSYGENFMDGGAGDDTYVLSAENTPPWERLVADDLIVDGEGADRVLFLNDIAREDIYFTLDGADLLITYGIENQNRARIVENAVERFETSDGSFVTREQVVAAIEAVADRLGILSEQVSVEHMSEDVTLKALQYNAWTDDFVMQVGDPEWNEFTGNSENEIVHGGEEYDDLVGHSGNDVLYGHSDDDWLNAGNGNDQYVFFRGDNNDTILDAENPLVFEGDDDDGGYGYAFYAYDSEYGGYGGDDDLIWEVQANEAPSDDTLLFKDDIALEDLEAFWATDEYDYYNEKVNDLMLRINPADGAGATADRQGNIQAILDHYDGQLYSPLEVEDLEEYSDKALRHLVHEIDRGYSGVTQTPNKYNVLDELYYWSRQTPFFRDYKRGDDTVTIEQFYDERYTLENIVLEGDNVALTNNDIMDLMSTDSAEMIRGVDWAGNTIDADAGNDAVIGGDLADTISGGEGKDYIHGRMGDDTYRFEQGDGHDQLTDGPQDFLEVVEGARYWEGYREGGAMPSAFAMEVALSEPVSVDDEFGDPIPLQGALGDPILTLGGDPGTGDGGGYDKVVFGDGIYLQDIGFAKIGYEWDPSLYVGYGSTTIDWDWDDVDDLTWQYGNAGDFGFSIGDSYGVRRSDPIYENDVYLPDQFTEDRAIEEFVAAGGGWITWEDLQQGFYDAQNFIWDNEDALWEIEYDERDARGYVDRSIWSKWQRVDREVVGTEGNDDIVAGDGDDTVAAGAGDDSIEAGFGTDVIDGGTGDDVYIYNRWDGFDTITDPGGSDTIAFGPDIRPEDLVAAIDPASGDLTLGVIDLVDEYWFYDENELEPYRPDPAKMADRIVISDFWSLDGRIEDFIFGDDVDYAMSAMDLYNYFFTSEGDDEIFGLEGDNELCASTGDDIITLGDGDHEVRAGDGNDVVTLGMGDHYIIGGGGNDLIYSSDGSDYIESGCGDDVIFAGGGDDEIYVWGETNTVYAGGGDDQVFADGLTDHIYGGAGNDAIVSDDGEEGDQFYHIGPGDGHDTVYDFGGIDALVVEGGYTLDDVFIRKQGFDPADSSIYDVFVALPDGTTATLEDWSLPENRIENIIFGEDAPLLIEDLFNFQARSDTIILEEEMTTTGVVETVNAAGQVLFSMTTDAQNGTFTFSANGSWEYTPKTDFFGEDSIQITATDENGDTDVATIRFAVSPVNDGPTIETGIASFFISEDSPGSSFRVDHLFNDVDDTELSYSISANSDPSLVSTGFITDTQGVHLTLEYDPDAYGESTITLRGTDAAGAYDETSFTVYVDPVNDAPVVEDPSQSFTMLDVRELIGQLAASDVDGDTLFYSVETEPKNGVLVVDDAGNWKYTADDLFMDTDSAVVTVADGNGGTADAVLTFDVQVSPPKIEDISVSLEEDAEVHGQLDIENPIGGALSLGIVEGPLNGSFRVNQDRSFDYEPEPDFNGTDSLTVEVSNAYGLKDTAVLSFDVASVNDAPVVEDPIQTFVMQDIREIQGQILASDLEENSLFFSVVTAPENGSMTIDDSGNWIYKADELFRGDDSAQVIVSDDDGGLANVELFFNVSVSAPSIVSTLLFLNEDTTLYDTLSVVNPGGGELSYTIYKAGSNGEFEISGDGTFSYTPARNYFGPDHVEVAVQNAYGLSDTAELVFNVASVNDVPAPLFGISDFSVLEDWQDVRLSLSPLFEDADDAKLSYSVSGNSKPDLVTGTIVEDGKSFLILGFTPNGNGESSLTVRGTDEAGAFAESTFTLTVTPINDAPAAEDDSFFLDEDNALTIALSDLLVNDSDVDGDSLSVNPVPVTGPAHGTLSLSPDGSFVYTPNENFNGADGFTYRVQDGNGLSDTGDVEIVVAAVNDAPVVDEPSQSYEIAAVRMASGQIGAFDVDGDPLAFSVAEGPENGSLALDENGNWTYTPGDLFIGDDRAVVAVSDGNGGAAEAELLFEVLAAPPVAEDFTVELEEDTVVSGKLSVVNPGGGALVYEISKGAGKGVLEIDESGNWTYTPEANFNGADTAQITVTNEYGFSDTAQADFSVAPVNDAPVAPASLDYVLFAAANVSGSVPASDVDGDALAFAAALAPEHGRFEIDGEGRWAYTPDADFAGKDRVRVTVSDGNGGTAETELLFKVNVFEGGTAVVGEGGTGTILMDGISKDELTLTRQADDLYIAVRDRGSITLAGYFAAPENGVKQLSTLEGPLFLEKERIAEIGAGCGWKYWIDRFGRWGEKNLIYGSDRSEVLFGAGENDVLFGAGGNDEIFAADGDDTLVGGEGKDHLWGWRGEDTLYGDGGSDHLYGGDGNDALIGGDDNDRMNGGGGDDWLFGDAGDDRLDGDSGSDLLLGGIGDDVLEGGSGSDTYRFAPGDGLDRLYDYGGGWCRWRNDGGDDTVLFAEGVAREDVALYMRRKDLYLQYGDDDVVMIEQQGHFKKGIERIELADGSFLTDADINGIIQQMAAYAVNEGICLRSVEDVRKNEALMALIANSWHAA